MTRPTDEEIRATIEAMRGVCVRHKIKAGCIYDGIRMLDAWLAERQAAGDGVTYEITVRAINAFGKAVSPTDNFGFDSLEVEDRDQWMIGMRAALQSIAQPVRVPDGWKLVPIEPTDAMLDHIAGTRFSRLPPGKQAQEIAAYSRMLSAAPAYNGKKEG